MQQQDTAQEHSLAKSFGLGVITGAADDDCSAIGTYAQAGAQLGYGILWMAPVLFPMMLTVVYLSGKLGQVTGQGLFSVLKSNYSRWLLYAILLGVIIGNVIEAAADIGAIAASIGLLLHVPAWLLILFVSVATFILQVWGSYRIISNVFRVLAISLIAYIASAFLAKPDLHAVFRGTLLPHIRFNKETVALIVAMIGTSLSAYIYTWQSNEEVEEKKAAGRLTMAERRRTTPSALRASFWDVFFGMLFSCVVMYFILLSASATLFQAGHHSIESAADAASALRPLAGSAASLLFTAGIVGVGFLAVPVMTTGAAYDVCQTFNWKNGLQYKLSEAKHFYGAIAVFTFVAMGLNFLGINPMHALVLSGIVQGFSTPPLLLLILLITNRPSIMGEYTNRLATNLLGFVTLAIISACTCWLIGSSVF